MLNKAFRNNGFVVSVGNGMGSVLFPCPPANVWLRDYTSQGGISWWGCGNYGWNQTSSATYGYYTDGNCGEYSQLNGTWSLPSGSVLYSTDCCQVVWDGSSYYVNDNCNPCSPSGSSTGNTRNVNEQSIYWAGCNSSGSFVYQHDIESEYNDGNCSTYWMWTGTWHAEDNAEIYNYNNCCYVRYRLSGNTYDVSDNCNPCPESGTLLRSDSSPNMLYWSGCGNSGSWAYSTNVTNYYADGNCGEYSAGGVYEQSVGTMIYDNGCCTVTYSGSGNYSVNDNCGNGCPTGPTGNTGSQNGQWFNWYGCGNSGYFTYSYQSGTEYHDGMCGTYWSWGTWSANNGDMIYDNGCCTVTYNGNGGFNVNDNCNPPPPDYPSAGTILNSGSSDITQDINYSGYTMDGYENSQSTNLLIGSSWYNEIADGMGGSTYESGSNYLNEGLIVFTPNLGVQRILDWYVSDGGGSYNGSLQVGLDVTPWVMSGMGAIPSSSTTFVDKFSSGFIIFESNEFWNGDANVKTRVEYQSGAGYITTTITF